MEPRGGGGGGCLNPFNTPAYTRLSISSTPLNGLQIHELSLYCYQLVSNFYRFIYDYHGLLFQVSLENKSYITDVNQLAPWRWQKNNTFHVMQIT